MVLISKKKAGSDSHGNVWERDGEVVDVPRDEALALLAIPDGGFAEVAPEPEPETPKQEQAGGDDGPSNPNGDDPAGQQPAPVVGPVAPVALPVEPVTPVVEPASPAEVTEPLVEQPPAPVEQKKQQPAPKRPRSAPADKG
jgi:hypothetical protein